MDQYGALQPPRSTVNKTDFLGLFQIVLTLTPYFLLNEGETTQDPEHAKPIAAPYHQLRARGVRLTPYNV